MSKYLIFKYDSNVLGLKTIDIPKGEVLQNYFDPDKDSYTLISTQKKGKTYAVIPNGQEVTGWIQNLIQDFNYKIIIYDNTNGINQEIHKVIANLNRFGINTEASTLTHSFEAGLESREQLFRDIVSIENIYKINLEDKNLNVFFTDDVNLSQEAYLLGYQSNLIDNNTTSLSNTLKRLVSAEVTARIAAQQYKLTMSRFDSLIAILDEKKKALMKKGLVAHSFEKNKHYLKVAQAALDLITDIKVSAKNFAEKPTSDNYLKLCDTCIRAIDKAKPEFKKHRDFWYQISPIFRQILGVLAIITIIPAIATEILSRNGFVNTFFKLPPTDSYEKLKIFEDCTIGEHGVLTAPLQ